MDLRKLKTLIDLVSESNISELEITETEGKVRIVKGGVAAPVQYVQAVATPAGPAIAAAPTNCCNCHHPLGVAVWQWGGYQLRGG